MTLDLSINISKNGPITTIIISGELDDFHSPKLQETFKRIIETEDCKKLIVDLQDVTFIDSVGLGTIAIAGRKMMDVNGKIRLVSAKPVLVKLFNTSGILEVLKDSVVLLETTEQARDRF